MQIYSNSTGLDVSNRSISHNLKKSCCAFDSLYRDSNWFHPHSILQKSGKSEKPKAEKPKAEQKAPAKGKVEKPAKPAEAKPKPAAATQAAKDAPKKAQAAPTKAG